MKTWNLTLVILITNTFLISSSNTLVLPFLSVYISEDLKCSPDLLNLYVPLCYSITFIISIFVSPLWGHFADKFGKKNMLVRVSVLLAFSYLFCFLSTTPLQLCLARAFQGFACGMTPAIISFAASLNTSKDSSNDTGLHMGFIQSSNLIGTIVGPCIGGFLTSAYSVKFCFACVFVCAVVISLVNIICIRDKHTENSSDFVCTKNLSMKTLLHDPIMQSLSSCIFINSAVIMMIVPILTGFVSELTNDDKAIELSGFIFALSGIAGALAAPFWGKIGGTKGFLKVLVCSTFLSAVVYLFQSKTDNIYVFAILQFMFGLCICATTPSVHSITAKHIDKSCQSKAYAMTYSASQFGSFCGPIISGITVFYAGERNVFVMCSILLLLLSSHLIVINIKRKK